ncbi:MAG: glycosyltransferase [Acidimicrobiales bacterium]
MRVLMATTAGAGHFGPLVPFATALRAAGHDVAVAAPECFAPVIARAGFAHHPFADASPDELGAVFGSLAGLSHDEANAIVIGEVFGRIDTRAALPGMEALVRDWSPDLILRETCEFSSYIVAEAAGVPHVHMAVGLAAFGAPALPLLEAPLVELGAEGGLAGLRTAPSFTLVPTSLEGPTTYDDLPPSRFRDDTSDGSDDPPLPDWWGGSSEPLMYVTFGSVAGGMGLFPGFYREVIAALGDLPVRILVTIGDAGDPAALGSVPPNVQVENWWPQRSVMAHASAMVGHGGFGTTLAGLAAGVPMVVVPLFADQPLNASRVEAVGAGIALDGGTEAIHQLRGAVTAVLDQDSYRTSARRMADEIRRLPPASELVPILEDLARNQVA